MKFYPDNSIYFFSFGESYQNYGSISIYNKTIFLIFIYCIIRLSFFIYAWYKLSKSKNSFFRISNTAQRINFEAFLIISIYFITSLDLSGTLTIIGLWIGFHVYFDETFSKEFSQNKNYISRIWHQVYSQGSFHGLKNFDAVLTEIDNILGDYDYNSELTLFASSPFIGKAHSKHKRNPVFNKIVKIIADLKSKDVGDDPGSIRILTYDIDGILEFAKQELKLKINPPVQKNYEKDFEELTDAISSLNSDERSPCTGTLKTRPFTKVETDSVFGSRTHFIIVNYHSTHDTITHSNSTVDNNSIECRKKECRAVVWRLKKSTTPRCRTVQNIEGTGFWTKNTEIIEVLRGIANHASK